MCWLLTWMFKIYYNKCSVGYCFNAIVLNHLYYADDLCLLSSSVHGLHKLLSISVKYATDHDIVFNESKSVCLYFKPMHFKIKPVNSIYLNGGRIKIDSHCKYVGHIVSDHLSDNRDIHRHLRSLHSKSNMLLQTFGACLSNVKQHLFMTYCGSMCTIQLWCRYTKKQYKNIIIVYNNVFCNFLGYDRYCSASGMFVEGRVDTFNVLIRRMVYSFRERIYNSENNLIKCIVYSTACWKASDLLSS